MASLKLDVISRGPHLPTLVASSISREIAEGRLKPGDQLPTEQALAKTFGVSRNVVREAIARLRSENRVWSQQGRGAFVADAGKSPVLAITQDDLRAGEAFASLFELRGLIEVQGAALAAQRRTAKDVKEMRKCCSAMTDAPYGSVAWLREDLNFHLAVANATKNAYIVQLLQFVSERVRESILASAGKRSDEMAQVTLAEHGRILAAIEARDTRGANEAMRAHLDNAAARVGTQDAPGRKPLDLRRARGPRELGTGQSAGQVARALFFAPVMLAIPSAVGVKPSSMANANRTFLKPVGRRPSLSATLVESFLSQIESGALTPGQRLPTEQEIVAAAGVSRSVVREAFASLKARGVVTTRQGLGAFVAEKRAPAFAVAADEMDSLSDVLSLLELRMGIESEAAALAAARRNPSDLAEIDAKVEAMDAAIKSGGGGASEDAAFHSAVLSAAHNPYFSRIFETFGGLLIPRSRIRLDGLPAKDRSRYLSMIQREHRVIRGAIKRREADAARTATYGHLKSSYNRYRAAFEAGGDE